MMDHPHPTPVEEVTRALETAISLASSGRYAELSEQAAVLEGASASLVEIKRGLENAEISEDGLRTACEQIKRKILVLSEVMRHTALVEAGLLQVDGAARSNYSRTGDFPSPGPGRATTRRLVNEEA